jgi:Predicted periplasmic solute-binding protein
MNQQQHSHKKKYWWAAAIVVILLICGLIGTKVYINSAMKPVNSAKNTQIQVKIPLGASNKKIGTILQDKKLNQEFVGFRLLHQNTQQNII